MVHIISTKQFLNTAALKRICSLAADLEKQDKVGALPQTLKGKLLASLFYEPSTRTRFSFEAAMQKLGGSVITTESAGHFSSVTKGETLQDTIKIISEYADVIVLRHSIEGSAAKAAEVAHVPIINAGDGAGEHPTQALLDLYTIIKEIGRADSLRIVFVGDLKYGRTIHSLIILLALYKNITMHFVAPEDLRLPAQYKEYLIQKNVAFTEHHSLEPYLGTCDVLYVTRIQKERFVRAQDYEKVKSSFIIDGETLKELNERAIIMHPLPRVNEITTEVDNDKRAAYFRQAKNGLYLRMALLATIFSNSMDLEQTTLTNNTATSDHHGRQKESELRQESGIKTP